MDNAAPMQWLDDPAAIQQARLRQGWAISLCAHGILVAALFFVPEPEPYLIPDAITVNLISAIPAAPAPPAPEAKPLPPPMAPAQKVKILPKRAPSAEARPRKKPEPVVTRRPKPKELAYDDALAKLRDQLGEAPPAAETLADADQAAFDKLLAEARTTSKGAGVDAELARWSLAVKRHLRAKWVTPPDFRERGLATELRVELARDGRVVGSPEVVRSSGNPYYDDNTVRAVMRASPLPRPPSAGTRTIIFTAEE